MVGDDGWGQGNTAAAALPGCRGENPDDGSWVHAQRDDKDGRCSV